MKSGAVLELHMYDNGVNQASSAIRKSVPATSPAPVYSQRYPAASDAGPKDTFGRTGGCPGLVIGLMGSIGRSPTMVGGFPPTTDKGLFLRKPKPKAHRI
jgi:hypothetical protein